jgi:hypothetical protein
MSCPGRVRASARMFIEFIMSKALASEGQSFLFSPQISFLRLLKKAIASFDFHVMEIAHISHNPAAYCGFLD